MEEKSKNAAEGLKKLGKAAANTAAGAGLAASLLVGGAVGMPAEFDADEAKQPAAIVQTVQLDNAYEAFALAGEALPPEETDEKRGVIARIRAWLRGLPLFARLLIMLPLWAAGFGLIYAVTLAAGVLGVPVVGAVVKALFGAAAVLGLVLGGMKLAFPDTPLKKLLGRRNVTALAVCAGVFAIAAALAGLLWRDKPWLTPLVCAAAAGLYMAYFCLFVRKKA